MFHATPVRAPGKPSLLPRIPLLTFLVWAVAGAGVLGNETDKRRNKAAEQEKRGAWAEASRSYDELIRKDRGDLLARTGFSRCTRRIHLSVRHADPVYRELLQRLQPPQALDAYDQVLTIITVAFPDRSRTNLSLLFKEGLRELRLALEDPHFRKHHLVGVKPEALKAFASRLASWPQARIHSRVEARDQVLAVARSASRDGVLLRPALVSAIIMEFAAGACNALDDHSSFLSPGHLALVQAAIKGKLVGVGLEIGIVEAGLEITRIIPRGPADEAGLVLGDRVWKIAGQPVENLPADAVAERLRGDPGTTVDVEVSRASDPTRRTIRLIRRAVFTPSVESELLRIMDGSPQGSVVGYLRIHFFQDSTSHEVKEAIGQMANSMEPMKGLILDLRGNPGGLFKSAVNVAELFATGGVLVIGQSPFKEYNRPFKAETPGIFQLPMVVLVNGDTASAAEVLAGALKDGRAWTRLVGQTTNGKGSIQCIIPMEKGPLDRLAGIRLTVARLFSPTGQPYTSRGVTPHHPSDLKGDALMLEAQKHLLEQITGSVRAVVRGSLS